MLITERILEIVEKGRALGLSNWQVAEQLYRIGVTKVIRVSASALAVYYLDDDGEERFVVIAPNEFNS